MNRAQATDAPAGLLPLPRPLMTGEVLDASFRLFRAALLRCLPYSGLAVLALQLPSLYATFFSLSARVAVAGEKPQTMFRGAGMPPETLADRQIIFFVGLAICTLLFGVITLRMQAVSRGLRPRFRTEIGTALRRWPVSVIATVAALGLPVGLISFWSLFNLMLPTPALIVLALPLLWPTAIFISALPAFWCDRLGPFAAIAQAVRLSRRRTWRLVGAIVATGCMVAVFYVVAAVIIGMLAPLLGRADLVLLATISSMMWLIVGAFGVPFVLAMLVVSYEDLKLREAERRGASA